MVNNTIKLFVASVLIGGFLLSSAHAENTWLDPLERDWTIRLTGAAFKPDIDSQFDASTAPQDLPYESFFGTEKPLMFTVGVERFLSNLGGGLSIGMTFGYWNVSGAMKSPDSDLSTNDETELILYPMSVEASYYFDIFANELPIIPFARIGADYCVWDVLDGSGETTNFVYQNDNGQKAVYEAFGATQGWHYGFGVQLLLDNLDPTNADAFERDAGVKNTYLGIEYRKAQIDDFGNAQSLRVGGQSINFGLYIDL